MSMVEEDEAKEIKHVRNFLILYYNPKKELHRKLSRETYQYFMYVKGIMHCENTSFQNQFFKDDVIVKTLNHF